MAKKKTEKKTKTVKVAKTPVEVGQETARKNVKAEKVNKS